MHGTHEVPFAGRCLVLLFDALSARNADPAEVELEEEYEQGV